MVFPVPQLPAALSKYECAIEGEGGGDIQSPYLEWESNLTTLTFGGKR